MAESRIPKPKIAIISILILIAANAGITWAHVGSPCITCSSCHIVHNYFGAFLTIDPAIYYDPPDPDPTIRNLCLSCHTITFCPTNPTKPPSENEYHDREDCTSCHDPHTNAITGLPGVSHSTHIEAERGPQITCSECHDTSDYSYFKSGDDTDGDGKYSFSETDVCDPCHSPGGAYDGVDSPAIGAKPNWDDGVYDAGSLKPGKEQWCVGCHDEEPAVINTVNAPDISLFWTSGHGRNLSVQCIQCHDITSTHTDGEPRTYAFDSDHYGPDQSGVAYQAGYRLQSVNDQVPLMIPANYGLTFGYSAQTMKDNAFRLCFRCHDFKKILDDTPGDGLDTNFKASLPNPPRNYSYAWGSGADVNEHVAHIMNYVGPFADSDWDTTTVGPGGSDGSDTLTACSTCHNVHGADGIEGSTNEPMIRDGVLSGRTGYRFSYVIQDTGAGGYPMVTSTSATQSTSVGAIFRNNTADMCGGSMCHGNPTPPSGSSYDATGSSWGTYLEYYRPWSDHGL
jgi:hypothetical protein